LRPIYRRRARALPFKAHPSARPSPTNRLERECRVHLYFATDRDDDLVAVSQWDVGRVAMATGAVDPCMYWTGEAQKPARAERLAPGLEDVAESRSSLSEVHDAASFKRPRRRTPERGEDIAIERQPSAGDADSARHDDHLAVREQLDMHTLSLVQAAAQPAEGRSAGKRPAGRRLVFGAGTDGYGLERLSKRPARSRRDEKRREGGGQQPARRALHVLRRYVALACLPVLFATLIAAPPARADGDPASDVLPTQDVYYGAYVDLRAKPAAQLLAMLQQAREKGFETKVALISDVYDLGVQTALWKKPQDYAKLLAEELEYVYSGRVLIVMPNGYGYWDMGESGLRERQTLQELAAPRRTTKLLGSAITAVQQLARREGITLRVPDAEVPPDGLSNSMADPGSTPSHTPSATATPEATATPSSVESGGSGALLFLGPFAAAGLLAVGVVIVRRRRERASLEPAAPAPAPQPVLRPATKPAVTVTLPKATVANLADGLIVPVNAVDQGMVSVTLSTGGREVTSGTAEANHPGHLDIRLAKVAKAERFRGKALSLKVTAANDSTVTRTLKVR
jgi:hypothetical protein